MSDNQVRREWDEVVISSEKGKRVVHYILKDSIGNSLLAVVGKDRSVNHLSYTVTEDYLRVFGPTSKVHAGTKWESRRDVINWLISVVSRGGPIMANSTNVSKKSNDEVEKWGPNEKRLKTEVSSKGTNPIKLVVRGPKHRVLSKLDNENIEILSQDSSLKGCWFRCNILNSFEDCILVRYKDVLGVDGSRKLEDWVLASTKAAPDKLGMRHVGRLTVRPSACQNRPDFPFKVGSAVDAWWCNGWWEGVVIGCDTLEKSNFQIYFPGEDRFLTIASKNIRVSRDWIDGKWADIKAKPDILYFLSSIFSTVPKQLTPLPVVAETYSSTLRNGEVLQSSSSSDEPQAVKELNFKKRLTRRYNKEMARGKFV
ncbi:hypothetical protein CASFOL_040592 [Castilleja foliolosa]|uniref:Agenet domain-containing protein n=1 Tax=Castilleja foliolosa TaxID=1961234 RepID=A0ABD3BC17_9LAMI